MIISRFYLRVFLDVHEMTLFAKASFTSSSFIFLNFVCFIFVTVRLVIILNVKPLHSRVCIADDLSFRSHDSVRVNDLNTLLSDTSRHEFSFKDDRALQGARLID